MIDDDNEDEREARRKLARMVLDAAREGIDVPEEEITRALHLTGDLRSTWRWQARLGDPRTLH